MRTANVTNYKRKVSKEAQENARLRFWNHLWSYHVGQLTTANITSMKKSVIGGSGKNEMMLSDLQPHALHTFPGHKHPELCVAIAKQSKHIENLSESSKGSIMVGHTNPQIFHWFKQLGSAPPRSMVKGEIEVLSGDLLDDVWNNTFVKHPIIHEQARDLWEADSSKTEGEREKIRIRERKEDEQRITRMSGNDWRAKHRERERAPTAEEEEESPMFVMKAESFQVVRFKAESMGFTDTVGNVIRVWDDEPLPKDPLCRIAPRFLRLANTSRTKLVSCVNMNYNIKLANLFIYDMCKTGLWAMASEQNFMNRSQGGPREQWNEYFLEFGKDQEVVTGQDLEYWFKGLMHHGTPEVANADTQSVEEADMDDVQFRYD